MISSARLHPVAAFLVASALSIVAAPVSAATIWTDWTSATIGNPGSALGTVSGVTVRYAGEVNGNTVTNGTDLFWNPSTTYVGGTSTTSPDTVRDGIALNGSFTGTNTITFSSAVVNPLIAIWSLGQGGAPASFIFSLTPTFEVGGANANFGGSAITVSGNTVSGQEGNGVVQFTGTFSSISWTDTPENFYEFTVGINGVAGPTASVPEPLSVSLIALGLLGLGAMRRKQV
jgi:hypothetical protein